MKKATIRIEDEVTCQIGGLEDIHSKMFYEAYGIPAKNFYFNPKYKLGTWDGKIRFYHADGQTYQYLLDEIIPKISQLDYDINVQDHRSAPFFEPGLIDDQYFSHLRWEDTDEPIIMYEHQVRVANALLREGRGIGIAATGAGKTLICGAVASQYNKAKAKVGIIVPSSDLVEQTREDLLLLGLDCGEYSGDVKDTAHATVVSTWQALQNLPKLMQEFDVVLVDEAHGLRGAVLQDLMNVHGKNIAHRFGVTGTLPKEKCDAMSILCATGKVLATVTAKELIEAGVLARLDIHIRQLVEDFHDKYEEYLSNPNLTKKLTYAKFKESYFPDFTAEKSYTQKNDKRLEYIAQELDVLREQGNTFVLVDGVSVGKKLASKIEGAVFLHGADKKKVRKEIYQQFKNNNNLIVIATVGIASTGINIKRIYNLALVDIGKSFTRVVQSIGRGLRVAEDKDHVDVYDFCSDLKYGKRHVSERIKLYKEAEYPYNKTLIEYQKILDDLDLC